MSPDEAAADGHLDPDQRDDNHLDTADGNGVGLMEVSREGAKYLGRGAGSLFVCEDNEVSFSFFFFSLFPLSSAPCGDKMRDGENTRCG